MVKFVTRGRVVENIVVRHDLVPLIAMKEYAR